MNSETYTIYITDEYGMSEKAIIQKTDLELALTEALKNKKIFSSAFKRKLNI